MIMAVLMLIIGVKLIGNAISARPNATYALLRQPLPCLLASD